MPTPPLTIVLPAKNETGALATLASKLSTAYPEAEILVIDDGSTDTTAQTATAAGLTVHSHPYSMGNGAAIKTGARLARGETLVFMDADGQHDVADIARLLERMAAGFDMVIGARSDSRSHASAGRFLANGVYNRLASWMVNRRIPDLTSGLRAVRTHLFREFLHLLPNGFSYPTTITMAFFRAGYAVDYVPINAGKRIGQSHIRPLRDGLRFLIIIFKVATLYSPMKVFLPISSGFFAIGLAYYVYTFIYMHSFTNMSALLFTTAVVVFLIGLVSEQITQLMYQPSDYRMLNANTRQPPDD